MPVKTFDATCGGASDTRMSTLRETKRTETQRTRRREMTLREKIEGAAFAAVLIVGLPLLIVAVQ